jgi:hypothetical protein
VYTPFYNRILLQVDTSQVHVYKQLQMCDECNRVSIDDAFQVMFEMYTQELNIPPNTIIQFFQ